jgi:hypothetical protein
MVSTRSQSKRDPVKIQEKLASVEPFIFVHTGKGSVLWDEFSRRASVTTIETKFAVSPNIAEFWCFLTVREEML